MSTKKPDGKKQPVLNACFRMAVEKVILGLFDDPTKKTLEMPATLTKEQSNFVHEFAFKLGLRTRISFKHGIVVHKADPTNVITNYSMELRTQSKKIILNLLEVLEQRESITFDGSPESAFTNSLVGHQRAALSVPRASCNLGCIEARCQLPIFKHRDEILHLIKSNQVVIIESTTGSGKSTQVPQYLLEAATEHDEKCRIIVAEPKRICAIALAERVSYERGEAIGGTVGYQIRLESKVAPSSNLIFVTNGVILRMLMGGHPEEFFNGITALVIDEVHERDKFSDFLLLCLREYLPLSPQLKVVIMSATIDTGIFHEYFGGCPVLKLEGRSHHVGIEFVEDVLLMLDFRNDHVSELEKLYAENPDAIDNPRVIEKDIEDWDGDTKETVNSLLAHMSKTGEDYENDFHHFFYMVTAENVPVDYRSSARNKTALMCAVENQLENHVVKLLNMNADPTLTVNAEGREINALDIAVEKNNVKLAEILGNHIELMNRPTEPIDANAIKCTPYNRKLLDIYYDSLTQPSVNRGVFLEDVVDLNLIVQLVRYLHFKEDHSKAILIFLPGHDEIVQLANLLCNALDTNYDMFVLHSQMRTSDQSSVFDDMPSETRKIILGTNIAESSITVNDVVFVIDSGKEKKKEFNASSQISSLRPQWISKASAKQRMGRAGRLSDGVVFRMYSRDRYSFMMENSKPEFLRDDLSELCLQAKIIAKPGETIKHFMSKAISPPPELTVEYSIAMLQKIGALDEDNSLTPLGIYLADIPLKAQYGKMLIYGIFFKCIDPILTLVSILSIREPFTMPSIDEHRQQLHQLKRATSEGTFSDHFVLLKIFQKWNEYKTKNEFDGGFCEDNFVNPGTMERISTTRNKILGYLRSIRLVQSVGNISVLNENSHRWSVVKACIAAGCYPEIAQIVKDSSVIKTAVDDKISVMPGSVLRISPHSKLLKEHLEGFPTEWMVFDERIQGRNSAMVKTCSLVTGVVIALTSGKGLCVYSELWSDCGEPDEDDTVVLRVDDFIKFSASHVVASALMKVRCMIDDLMTKFLTNVAKFKFTDDDELLVEAMVEILELEDEKVGFKTKHDGVGNRPRVVTREYNVEDRQEENN